MATANAAESEEQRCGYCLVRRTEMEDPRELPCTHVFCLPCLYGERCSGDITCPICKKKCAVNDLRPIRADMNAATNSEENIACDSCKTEVKETAAVFCVQCEKALCRRHEESHDDIFDLEHDKISIASFIQSKNKYQKISCSEHKTKKVTLGCYDCFQLFCESCRLYTNCTGKWVPPKHEITVTKARESAEEFRSPQGALTDQVQETEVSLPERSSNLTAIMSTATVSLGNSTLSVSGFAGTSGLFGEPTTTTTPSSGISASTVSGFAGTSGLFGKPTTTTTPSSGISASTVSGFAGTSGIFGQQTTTTTPSSGISASTVSGFGGTSGIFGKPTTTTTPSSGISASTVSGFAGTSGLFGKPTTTTTPSSGISASTVSGFAGTSGLFGQQTTTTTPSSGISASTVSGFGVQKLAAGFGFGATSLSLGQSTKTGSSSQRLSASANPVHPEFNFGLTASPTEVIKKTGPVKKQTVQRHRLLPIAALNRSLKIKVERRITTLAAKQTEIIREEKRVWQVVDEVEQHSEELKRQVDQFIQLECDNLQARAKEFKQRINEETEISFSKAAIHSELVDAQIHTSRTLENTLTETLERGSTRDVIKTFFQTRKDLMDILVKNVIPDLPAKISIHLFKGGMPVLNIIPYRPERLEFLTELESDTDVTSMTWIKNGTLLILTKGNAIQTRDSDLRMLRETTVDSKVLDVAPYLSSFISLQQVGLGAHVYLHSATSQQAEKLMFEHKLPSPPIIGSIASSDSYIAILLSGHHSIFVYNVQNRAMGTVPLSPKVLPNSLVHINKNSFIISYTTGSPAGIELTDGFTLKFTYPIDIGNAKFEFLLRSAELPKSTGAGKISAKGPIDMKPLSDPKQLNLIAMEVGSRRSQSNSPKIFGKESPKQTDSGPLHSTSSTGRHRFSKTKDSSGYLYTYNYIHKMIAVSNSKGEGVATLEHEKLLECAKVTGIAVHRDLLVVSSADGRLLQFRIV